MDISLSMEKFFSIISSVTGWTLLSIIVMLAIALVIGVAKSLISLFIAEPANTKIISDYAEPERLKPVK